MVWICILNSDIVISYENYKAKEQKEDVVCFV